MAGQDDTGTRAGIGAPLGPIGAALSMAAAVLSSIGTVWIAALMFLVVGDVIGRNFMNAPITGVAEIAARSVVATPVMGRLTRVDFLIRGIGARLPMARVALERSFAIAGAIVFALIVWASWGKTVGSWTSAEFFGVQGVFTIPTFPFRAITIIGASLACLACLYRAAHLDDSGEADAS
ncbi:MAG TPA: TRAP transporter small permease subunit [Paracoccaceae bacterium]|nr:TRAP transporter small permease subunit [Paracoccaceae bacterium]